MQGPVRCVDRKGRSGRLKDFKIGGGETTEQGGWQRTPNAMLEKIIGDEGQSMYVEGPTIWCHQRRSEMGTLVKAHVEKPCKV